MKYVQSTHEVKKSVVDKVIETITQKIKDGEFIMGEKLPSEFELMEMLQVSRNSLREAMKILNAMGVVEILRGDGTYVCKELKPSTLDFAVYSLMLTKSTEQEIVELRELLDENILRLALRKCSVEEIDKLQEMIYEMQDMFKSGNIREAAMLDYNFHIYISSIARNQFLNHIVTVVYGLFENSIENNIRSEELFAQATEHHQEIVDCLRVRDESKVAQVISNSLSSWKKNVRQKM